MWTEFKRTMGKITPEQMALKELYETKMQLLQHHSDREDAVSACLKSDASIAKCNSRIIRLETMLDVKVPHTKQHVITGVKNTVAVLSSNIETAFKQQ